MKIVKDSIRLLQNARYDHYFYRELNHYTKGEKKIVLPTHYQKEILDYYRQFGFRVSLDWHNYIYKITGLQDVRIIPDNLYHVVMEPHFMNKQMSSWEDKAYMYLHLPKAIFPECYLRRVNNYFINNDNEIISPQEAFNIIKQYDDVIIKPSLASGSGRGVQKVKVNSIDTDVLAGFGKNFIVQKPIVQSQQYSRFNNSSVNTEKIISFLFDGNVYILTSMLRVGAPGAITDSASSGLGYTIGINDDGLLNDVGYSLFGDSRTTDAFGIPFKGMCLEAHKEILHQIRQFHKLLPYFMVVSWDYAVDSTGKPVLIEYNLGYPETLIYQINNGPLFGSLTDQVLSYISKEEKNK